MENLTVETTHNWLRKKQTGYFEDILNWRNRKCCGTCKGFSIIKVKFKYERCRMNKKEESIAEENFGVCDKYKYDKKKALSKLFIELEEIYEGKYGLK